MLTNEEIYNYSLIFTEHKGNFTESPHYLNVINKLHIAKMDYLFYEHHEERDPILVYENHDLEIGESYVTRKSFDFGTFELRVFFDKTANITQEIIDTWKYICEISYLGISRIKLISNSMYYLFHDEMTGVYNTLYFNRHISNLIENNCISNYTAMYLNIRNCRYLNSVFGNKITDKIIVTLAHSLSDMIDETSGECISRLGGDFFTIIVLKENANKFIEKLTCFPIEFDYELDHINYPLSIKAGIANLDDTYDSFNKIMMAISAAHAVAKTSEMEPPIVYFSKSLYESKFIRDQLTNDFSRDLKANKVFVYFQPYNKIEGDVKTLVGCEALIRWRRDERLMTAAEIIPFAEKSKVILDVDMFVVDKVCSKIKEWKSLGYKTVPVACNLSVFDIKHSNMANDLINIIDKHGIDYSDITFEFNESAFVNEPVLMRNFVNEMRKYGIKIGIEDYSNSFLPYKLFTESAFDYIKIDYANIDTSNKELLLILKSVVSIAKSLEIEVIIKGANDLEIINDSINNNCNVFQCEHFDKPVSERFFENRLKNQ